MSVYLLDTDTISLFQYGHPQIVAAVVKHLSAAVGLTVLTVEEQLSGWYKELRRPKTMEALAGVYKRMADTVSFYSTMPILPLTISAIARYEGLKQLKLTIGKTDLRIAAIVLDQQAVLVTRNVRDFQQIPGLLIEDWSK